MDKLLHHYEQELGRLRNATRQYTDAHPDTAAALELGADASTDPEVERLLQSVALLNASMQQRIEENRSAFHRALLQTLQPHYLMPLPSCGIAAIDTSTARPNEVSSVIRVPRDTVLHCGGYRYSTVYEAGITPIALRSVRFQSTADLPATLRLPADTRSALAIALESKSSSVTFDQAPLGKLRVFIDAKPELRAALLDALLMHSLCVCLQVGANWRLMEQSPFSQVGLKDEESLLPCQPGAQSPRLLTELFHLPEKFCFVDVDLAAISAFCPAACQSFTLHVVLPASQDILRQASEPHFLLACTPMVNLFPLPAAPITLDGRSGVYPLVPDTQGCEIYSIESVTKTEAGGDVSILPFHGTQHDGPGPYWQLEAKEGIALRFVDREQRDVRIETGTVNARLICTNAGNGRPNESLLSEAGAGSFPIRFLAMPRACAYLSDPVQLCEALCEDDVSLTFLCKLLQLHGCKVTASLRSLAAKPATAWLQHPMGRLHMHGTEFTLMVDEHGLKEQSIYTLSELLACTLADKLRENRFAQLRIANQNGCIIHQLPPKVGTRKIV